MKQFIFFIITFLLLIVNINSQVNLNSGLIGYYPFNGNANDASGNNRNGSLVNGTNFGSDRFGNPNSSASFDGINDYISVPDNDGGFSSPVFSVVTWFYSESQNLQTLIGKRDFATSSGTGGAQYQMFINYSLFPGLGSNLVGNNSTCNFIPASSYINTIDELCNNRWNCIIVTFDGSRHKLFLNGVLKRDEPTPFNQFLSCNSEIRFGNWWLLDMQSFKGRLDDIRWYNRVLTQDEINLLSENNSSCNELTCNNWLSTPLVPSAVTVGDLDVSGNQLTIEAMFNRTAPLNNNLYTGFLVSKHTNSTDVNYALRPDGCEINTSGSGHVVVSQTCTFEINKNYHVAMVYNGTSLMFYRNGFLISQQPCTGNLTNNNLPTTIAQMSASILSDNQFLGYINEVRIWNIARTQAEIRNFMNTSLPSPSTTPGLLAYYQFNNLINKQGNPAYNGSMQGGSQVNMINSKCEFAADSCLFPGQCANSNDFSYSQNACNPKQVSFSTNGTGFNSIKWDLGDGNTVNALTSFNHLYSSLGTYTVKMIQDFGSCMDTIIKTISVNLQNDNLLIATNDTTICAGSTKQLLASPSLNFCWSPTTYLNNPGVSNPITSTPQNITYYYTADITGTNLIANGNFNAGNSGFTSQYTYTNPNSAEGQYFVGNNPQTWNAALSSCTDHTSGTGNMLMVNGATSPDVEIWKQTITVTPNTNYNFSAWVQSLISSNPAQIQVSINGNPIGNVSTAALATCLWSPLSVNWNSGNATSASITITNKNTQVTGNDFALDDISFASVIKKTDSVKITVSNPLVKTNNDTTFCKGGQVQLNTTGANSYSWSPATGLNNPNIPNPIASPLTTTQYIVTGITSAGCTAKDTVMININNGPIVTRANDTTICLGSQAQLFATGGIAYSWSPAATLNNSSIPNPIATPSVTTTYLVTVTGSNTCTTVDSVKVNIRSQNSFTVSPPLNVCPGKSVQLNAGGGDLYAWTPANSLSNALVPSPIATPGATTMYNVLITDTVCHFSSSLSTLVTLLQPPNVSAIKSNDIDCIYDKSTLSATGAQQYSWSPLIGLTNPQSATTIASPNATTKYFVTGIDVNGCENKDSITLLVTKTGKAGYLMPSAFTPNGDGLNDCYGLKYWGTIINLEFSIYNRWGERIFFTKNPGECWNGTYKGQLLDTDVFIYQVKASTTCDASIYRKGTFTLIR